MFRRHPFFDQVPSGGGGNPTPPAPSPAARVNALVDSAIARHGSAENALSVIMAQNVTLENQALADRQAIADLKQQVPAKDAVVLPAERARAFNAFEALKLTAEQVQQLQQDNGDLKAKDQAHGIERLAREGAPPIGYDPDAVAHLLNTRQLHAELREVEIEVERGGKKEKVKQKVPYVRPAADEKAPLVALTEYARTLPAFDQRALQAVATDKITTPAGGMSYPESRPAPAGARSGDPTADFITERNQRAASRPSPFAPPPRQAAAAAS